MSIRLISDIHLDEKEPAVADAFIRYIQDIPNDTEAVYLLGDIFELWIGDDNTSAFLSNIITSLATLKARGISLFIMHGNRDFLIGAEFCRQCHATLLEDEHLISQGTQTYLLMHGDSLCTDDEEYMQFRASMRNPDTQAFLLSKPLPERIEMAKSLRQQSQSMNSNKAEDIMDVNADAVKAVLEKHQTNILIHGHTHRPHIHHETDYTRIVLGDWHSKGWEVVLDNNTYQLNEFKIESL